MAPTRTFDNEQAQALLTAVRQGRDQWQSRRQIAHRLGKRYLNPVDIYLLDKMVDQGRIERVKLARPGIIPYTLRYRTIQTSQGAEQ